MGGSGQRQHCARVQPSLGPQVSAKPSQQQRRCRGIRRSRVRPHDRPLSANLPTGDPERDEGLGAREVIDGLVAMVTDDSPANRYGFLGVVAALGDTDRAARLASRALGPKPPARPHAQCSSRARVRHVSRRRLLPRRLRRLRGRHGRRARGRQGGARFELRTNRATDPTPVCGRGSTLVRASSRRHLRDVSAAGQLAVCLRPTPTTDRRGGARLDVSSWR
jgi:hypothetical protein